ncbi:MAG: hypothetical protein RL514_3480 [Verrucomicrobiota bacterium]|jgi:hypothetical protein
MVEIQSAIEQLPADEQKALSIWLTSFEDAPMTAQEEAALLASLDQATRQFDAGQGVPSSQVRNLVTAWAAK